MPYVPGFDYDIFVSYASDDNDGGIVEEFVETLEKHISDNLVNTFSKEKVRVYFDRERLANQTGVNWEEHLKAAASSSALLLPLLSPNYLSSDYCGKERGWFGLQAHVDPVRCPYAVAGWVPIGENPQPPEFDRAQRHPAGDSWLARVGPEERRQSCEEFALKLRDRLVEMRRSVSAVFLGSAVEGRGSDLRARIRDELEESGHRVVPGPDFVYTDPDQVRAALSSSLLAIHFPGDGLELEALEAIEESFTSARKTLLVQPNGSTLSEDEEMFLEEIDARLEAGGEFAGAAYTRLSGKTDDQTWEVVSREVRVARFQKERSEFEVGIACEKVDLDGAKELARVIRSLGVPTRYPPFDTATSITETLRALRDTITKSKALLCYWAAGPGRGLQARLKNDARKSYTAKAWYLGPPLDEAKASFSQADELVLRQAGDAADLSVLEPFLRELGWEPEE